MHAIPKLTALLVVVCSVFCTPSTAQHIVSGTVVDSKGKAVSFANIIVHKAQDSTQIAGLVTDDEGFFELEALPEDDYFLKTTFVGLKENIRSFTLSEALRLTITLSEETTELSEVVVLAKKPTLERKVDRLIFNIEDSSLSEQLIGDVLRKTPGILVLNDKVTVKGDEFQVYINDRRVSLPQDDLMAFLQSTPASNVASIEVITNPPARYDAQGGAIVNIVMDKALLPGYRGGLSTAIEQAVFPKYEYGTSHFFKSEKTKLYFNYMLRDRKLNEDVEQDATFFDNDSRVNSTWNAERNRIFDYTQHAALLNFDYSPNEKSTFSISLNGTLRPDHEGTTLGETMILGSSGTIDSTFVNNNDEELETGAFSANLGYVSSVSDNTTLSSDLQYAYSGLNEDQRILTNFFSANNEPSFSENFTSLSDQEVNIFSAQVDLSASPSETARLETGLKFAAIGSDNDVDQNRASELIDDTFTYNEENYAAYVSYENSLGKWNFKAGLRGEYSVVDGISEALGQTTDLDYFEVFPTAYIEYAPSEKHSYSLRYRRSIDRPDYAGINPFRRFQSFNATIEGDPTLLPDLTDNVAFGYTFDQAYTFELYYYSVDNALRSPIFQDNNSRTVREVFTNIEREVAYGLDFFTYKNITDFWSLSAAASVFFSEDRFRAIESDNSLVDNGLWAAYVQAMNELTLSSEHNWSADLGLLYVSSVSRGTKRDQGWANLNAGITKTTNNRRWTFQLRVEDILNTSNPEQTVAYLDQRSRLQTIYEIQRVRFSLRYNFGNIKLSQNNEVKESEEKERLQN